MTRAPIVVLVGAIALCSHVTSAASVGGTATVAGRPAANAVIYLEGTEDRELPHQRLHAVMDQKNLAFAPSVLPVVRGTVVEFTNSDDVQHNVFTPSAVAGKFDLGAYGPGGMSSVTLDEPGDVLVLCNIHMEMEAHILVLKDPYFATVAPNGSYRMPDVPPGTYTLHAWYEHLLPYSQSVHVQEDDALNVDLRLEK